MLELIIIHNCIYRRTLYEIFMTFGRGGAIYSLKGMPLLALDLCSMNEL